MDRQVEQIGQAAKQHAGVLADQELSHLRTSVAKLTTDVEARATEAVRGAYKKLMGGPLIPDKLAKEKEINSLLKGFVNPYAGRWERIGEIDKFNSHAFLDAMAQLLKAANTCEYAGLRFMAPGSKPPEVNRKTSRILRQAANKILQAGKAGSKTGLELLQQTAQQLFAIWKGNAEAEGVWGMIKNFKAPKGAPPQQPIPTWLKTLQKRRKDPDLAELMEFLQANADDYNTFSTQSAWQPQCLYANMNGFNQHLPGGASTAENMAKWEGTDWHKIGVVNRLGLMYLICKAQRINNAFAVKIHSLLHGTASVLPSPTKKVQRASSKTFEKYGKNPFCLLDIVRCLVVCDSPTHLLKSFQKLEESGIPIRRVKNAFVAKHADWGFRVLMVTVEFEGMLCEVQLASSGMYAVRSCMHKYYGVQRIEQAEESAVVDFFWWDKDFNYHKLNCDKGPKSWDFERESICLNLDTKGCSCRKGK